MIERSHASAEVVAKLVSSHRRFLAFLEPRVGNRADAEEILQAAFVKGLEHGADIRNGESAVAWFYRLLRNAVVDHYRHRDAKRRGLERQARETDAEAQPDPVLERVVCQCVGDLVATLKPEYADIVRRVDLHGETVAAVSASSGITPGNARVRLHRARTALRRRLEQTCGTCAEHGCLDCSCQRAP